MAVFRKRALLMRTSGLLVLLLSAVIVSVNIYKLCFNKKHESTSETPTAGSVEQIRGMSGVNSPQESTPTEVKPWGRVVINWTAGNDFLVFLHIQRTAGKSFLYSIGSATQYNQSLCKLNITSNNTNRGRIPKSWRLICPIDNATYYPSLKQTAVPTTNRPLTLKEWNRFRLRYRRMKPLPEMWLQSEATYQWPCGIHSFLSAMKPCIEKFYIKRYKHRLRRYHYFTLVRHPVLRYLSEYLYTYEGYATWEVVTGAKDCPGAVSEKTVPECYRGMYKKRPWYDVPLSKFLSCTNNWANNRQTWMLADHVALQCAANRSLVREEFEESLLESAKASLKSMAFFGVSDYLRESALLFQYKFNVHLQLLPAPYVHRMSWLVNEVLADRELYDKIVQRNRLDMMLYKYALELFEERLKLIGLHFDTAKVNRLFQY